MFNLQPIKDRLAAATPGPWTVDPNAPGMATVAVESSKPSLLASLAGVAQVNTVLILSSGPVCGSPAQDAELIANAPADLAALVAEVERLRTLIIAHRDGCNCNETQSETPPRQCNVCFALYEAVEDA